MAYDWQNKPKTGGPAIHKPDDIIKLVRKSGAQKVKVAVTDLDGVLRGKYIHVEKFLSAAETGLGFCNVVFGWDSSDKPYDNTTYSGWHTGFPDAKVSLDLATCRTIPWENDLPFIIGEFLDDDDKPLAICPRQLLKQIIAQAEIAGLLPRFGLEFEWLNLRETPTTLEAKQFRDLTPTSPGSLGFSIVRSSYQREFFNSLIDQLKEFDIPLEGLHTETGPGVAEAAIMAADALEAADRGVLFKTSTKEIAYQHGQVASFMARWHSGYPGSSGHMHQSMTTDAAVNVFYDAKDPNGMSQVFKHYVAGLLHCLPDIMPMFAPTVNSYKRFGEGFWAPTRVTWGIDNRTVALRVVQGGEKSTRLELRVPGSDVNPYLGIAASLAAGLYGIENKLPLTVPAVKGNGYVVESAALLPRTLAEATATFKASKLAKELFGDTFVEHFAATRAWEYQEFRNAVTDWELRRYLEII